MKKFFTNTIVLLILAVIVGICLGLIANDGMMETVVVIKQISGQIIFFLVPLIILGFVTPSIASLKGNVSKLLIFSFVIAYLSSIGAAFFSVFVSYKTIPLLNIETVSEVTRALPVLRFVLEIPPIMSVMTALILSIFIGLGVIWVNSQLIADLLMQFQKIVLQLVKRVLLPLLPFFVAANFCILTYEGSLSKLKVFLPVIFIVIVCHFIWLLILYVAAGLYAGKNSWQVLRYYAPAYFTAVGTMSSAATLGVALECIQKSPILDKKISDFTIPLFANIHLCGSVLTEVFFVCVVSQILYGTLPDFSTLSLFIFLLGIFAIGAPGVPGGTVLASLGLITSVLGFNEIGTALLITIFALQDSFGTACNITGDGALTLMVNTFAKQTERNSST